MCTILILLFDAEYKKVCTTKYNRFFVAVYITNQQNRSKQYVKENNIVVVNVPTESDGKFVYQNLFGFVITCEKRLIKGNDFVDKYRTYLFISDAV